jgi:hypothetical protein
MATNLDILIAAVSALNTATSQEAAQLQTVVDGIGGINTALSGATTTLAAEGAKLDAIQALIDNLRQTAGWRGAGGAARGPAGGAERQARDGAMGALAPLPHHRSQRHQLADGSGGTLVQ